MCVALFFNVARVKKHTDMRELHTKRVHAIRPATSESGAGSLRQALATPTTPRLHPAPPTRATTRSGPYPPHPPTRRGPVRRAGWGASPRDPRRAAAPSRASA